MLFIQKIEAYRQVFNKPLIIIEFELAVHFGDRMPRASYIIFINFATDCELSENIIRYYLYRRYSKKNLK